MKEKFYYYIVYSCAKEECPLIIGNAAIETAQRITGLNHLCILQGLVSKTYGYLSCSIVILNWMEIDKPSQEDIDFCIKIKMGGDKEPKKDNVKAAKKAIKAASKAVKYAKKAMKKAEKKKK